MSEQSDTSPDTSTDTSTHRSTDTTVDQERQRFGSAGWDALDDDTDESAPDVPEPDPAQDQG